MVRVSLHTIWITLGGEPQRRLWCYLSPSSFMKANWNVNLLRRLSYKGKELIPLAIRSAGAFTGECVWKELFPGEYSFWRGLRLPEKQRKWAGRPKGAGVVSSCSYFLLPAALLCTEALKVRPLCIMLGPVAKETPVCPCSYGGVSEQEWCKKSHLSHRQLTAEAPSKVLPIVTVSATSLSSLFSLPHVYTPLR